MKPPAQYPTRKVGILIFDGVELLDFAGPFEVFSAARKDPTSTVPMIEVYTIAEFEAPIICHNGLVVAPTFTLTSAPQSDIMVIPGGQGTRTAINRREVIEWIVGHAAKAELVTSVCTGSFLLAKAGLLDGKAATTHWASIERMRKDFPNLEVRQNVRYVDAGDVVSSAGVSAGIDMALYVLARLYSPEIAAATARGIEYEYWQGGENG